MLLQRAKNKWTMHGLTALLVLGIGLSNSYGQANSPTETLKQRDTALQNLVGSMAASTLNGTAGFLWANTGKYDPKPSKKNLWLSCEIGRKIER